MLKYWSKPNRSVASCKEIRNPGHFCLWNRELNPAKFYLWIENPGLWNSEYRSGNLESDQQLECGI